jgi:hypothetical protein
MGQFSDACSKFEDIMQEKPDYASGNIVFVNVCCFSTNVFCVIALTLSNPVFLPPAYYPALIYFGWERSWWITCNYPTVLKEKNRN